MTTLAVLSQRARFRAVTWLSTRPRLYYGVRRLSGRTDPLCIRPDTKLVIEGFPRSANSTTTYGFIARQPQPLHVAHHKHHAVQLQRAADWGIPAVVLIRAPREACLSLLALAAEARYRNGLAEREGLAFSDVFGAYIAFYEAVEPCLDRVLIGRFENVRDDIDGLIAQINLRFGTTFSMQQAQTESTRELGWHAMPNETRDRISANLAARFETELTRSAHLRWLVARAEAVNERYI